MSGREPEILFFLFPHAVTNAHTVTVKCLLAMMYDGIFRSSGRLE